MIVIQCLRRECQRFLMAQEGTKTRKCPYCRYTNKIEKCEIKKFSNYPDALEYLRIRNQNLVDQ